MSRSINLKYGIDGGGWDGGGWDGGGSDEFNAEPIRKGHYVNEEFYEICKICLMDCFEGTNFKINFALQNLGECEWAQPNALNGRTGKVMERYQNYPNLVNPKTLPYCVVDLLNIDENSLNNKEINLSLNSED